MNNLLKNIPIKDLQDFLYNRRRKNECASNQLYAQAADYRDKEKDFFRRYNLPIGPGCIYKDIKIDINDIRDLKLKKLLDDR